MKWILITLTFVSSLVVATISYTEFNNQQVKKEKTISLAIDFLKLQYPNVSVSKKETIDSLSLGGCVSKNSIFIVPKNISPNMSTEQLSQLLLHEYLYCSKLNFAKNSSK